MSLVEIVSKFLEDQSKGIEGTNLFCYSFGEGVENGILVTSTGGISPQRFIDGDNRRINQTFINIMIRDSSKSAALLIAEDLIKLFEKNTITNCVSNKPRREEPIYIGEEKTINGLIYLFGIDLMIRTVSNNL